GYRAPASGTPKTVRRMSPARRFAIILAGGRGARLWPLSREHHPKQFVELENGKSLYQLTLLRLLNFFKAEDCYTVLPEEYRFTARNQIEFLPSVTAAQKKRLLTNLIFEPCAKNTLAAIVTAMAGQGPGRQSKVEPDDLIYVFPSDHRIEPLPEFIKMLRRGSKAALGGALVLFGKRAVKARSRYGYILPGPPKGDGVRPVLKFVEKPSPKRIKEFLARKAYWNSGIFCFSRRTFYDEIAACSPAYLSCLRAHSSNEAAVRLKKLPAVSFDRAILEKTRRAVMIAFDFEWSDLVSWDNFLDSYPAGGSNVSIGQARFLDSKKCFAFSHDRLVAMIGLKDVLVIDAPDALLLVRRGQTDKVRTLFRGLGRQRLGHDKDSTTVYRPWGYYKILHQTGRYKVKEIGVYPGRSMSLQKHRHRSEHWNVVEGRVRVTIGSRTCTVGQNQSLYVPRMARHQIFNSSRTTARIIEVQIGDYLGEDDIVRYTHYH
ncbi:MAG: mannose-1-phosphate guanylyltransferase/mannose-6-phosphate isomerase, partial [Candidatus Omnitrophota bacterium]